MLRRFYIVVQDKWRKMCTIIYCYDHSSLSFHELDYCFLESPNYSIWKSCDLNNAYNELSKAKLQAKMVLIELVILIFRLHKDIFICIENQN